MKEQLLISLEAFFAEINTDAVFLLKIRPESASASVLISFPDRLVAPGYHFPIAVMSDRIPLMERNQEKIGTLLPVSLQMTLPSPPRAALFVPLDSEERGILLIWCAVDPPLDVEKQILSERGIVSLYCMLDHDRQMEALIAGYDAACSALKQAVVIIDHIHLTVIANQSAVGLLDLPDEKVSLHLLSKALGKLQHRVINKATIEEIVTCLKINPQEIIKDSIWKFAGEPSHLRVSSWFFDRNTISGRIWVFDDVSSIMTALEMSEKAHHAEATALKQSQLSENRLKLATDLAGMGIYTVNFIDGTIAWDERICKIMQLPQTVPADAVPVDFWISRIHPDDVERTKALIQETRSKSRKYCNEYRILLPDGSIRHIQSHGIIQDDANGRPIRLIGVKQDITRLREDEAALKTLWTAIEQGPVSVVITDADTAIQYVNPKFTEVNGYTPDEVIGKKSDILKSGLTEISVYESLWSSLQKGLPWCGEFVNKRKNGEVFHEEAFISPIFDNRHQLMQYVAVKNDITRRKAHERELMETHANLTDAYKQINESMSAAASIQQALIPLGNRDFRGIRHVKFSIPHQFVTGDVINIIKIDETHLAFYILDVSGHGIPAALLATTLSIVLQPSANFFDPIRSPSSVFPFYRITPPNEVVTELNRRFFSDHLPVQYFTMIYGVINTETYSGSMIQAGHPRAIQQALDGTFTIIDNAGLPVGMIPDETYENIPFTLMAGDRIFFYSDGITECESPDGEMFGEERLLELIRNERESSIEEIIGTIQRVLKDFRGKAFYDDDISLLIIERPSES
ncbi:MAG: SpoIIE family protein phosphatase [Chlorobiaceae bacterium]